MSVSFLGAQAALSGATASSSGRISTSSASAHTKGAYAATPWFTATTYPTAWILVQLGQMGTAGDALLDVAVGAASSEQVIIANLPLSCNTTASATAAQYLLPLAIPAGSRINARSQATTGSTVIKVQFTLFAPMFGGEKGLGQIETCGAVTGTSLGTTIPGHTTTANTKGTWTELIASTSFAYKWVCLGITHTNAVAVTMSWSLDIGIGAGSAEVVVVPDISLASGATIDALSNGGRSFPLSIPAGTRISARVACTVNTASERDVEVVLLGVG